MTTLTPVLKQAYVDAIQSLFGGSVQASTDQINQAVVDDIDTMMIQIAKCSETITKLSFGLVYSATVGIVVGHVISKIRDDLAATVAAAGLNAAISTLLKEWVNAVAGNRQFVGCINVARANWRSKVTIDLMDL